MRIARIGKADAVRATDRLQMLRASVCSAEDAYPGIDRWFERRVVPGLRDESRVGIVGLVDDEPVATAIVKRGRSAKFCHLRVREDVRNAGLGEVFFVLMASEARRLANGIHFTLPESLWDQQSAFFRSFGFEDAIPAQVQYRLFDQELACNAPFARVWHSALEKLPKLATRFSINSCSLAPALVLSIKPDYARLIIEGRKSIEVRARFSHRWTSSRILIYASSPVRALVCEATIREVHEGTPAYLWDAFGVRMACSREDFANYAGKRDRLWALELTDVLPYAAEMPILQFQSIIGTPLTPPQSHAEASATSPWGRVVPLVALLQAAAPRSIIQQPLIQAVHAE